MDNIIDLYADPQQLPTVEQIGDLVQTVAELDRVFDLRSAAPIIQRIKEQVALWP